MLEDVPIIILGQWWDGPIMTLKMVLHRFEIIGGAIARIQIFEFGEGLR